MGQTCIRPAEGVWQAFAGGALIARSSRALEVIEGPRPPVIYLPREDVAMDLLDHSATQTTCPAKGVAVHYEVVTPSGRFPMLAGVMKRQSSRLGRWRVSLRFTLTVWS